MIGKCINKQTSIVILMVGLILLMLLPKTVLANNDEDWSFEYHYNDNDVCDGMTLTKYLGDETSIRIPASFNGVPVVEIGEGAFFGRSDIVSIIIPDSIESIGEEAFYACGIESITIPDSVTSIGAEAFFGSKLHYITIPGSVKVIGEEAFSNCESIQNILIEDGVEYIGRYAFNFDENLLRISFPDSIKELGYLPLYRHEFPDTKLTVYVNKDSKVYQEHKEWLEYEWTIIKPYSAAENRYMEKEEYESILRMTGDWVGTFYNSQGASSLDLIMTEVDDYGNVKGSFSFYGDSDHPDAPAGSYTIKGKINFSTGEITIKPELFMTP